jgi:hypothetical protein
MNETSDINTATPETTVASAEPLSGMRLLPGENPADKEQLRLAMMAELAPKTAYQTRLAEQLVDYEWEIDRHRRLRDFCLLAQYQARARTQLDRGRPVDPFKGSSLTPDDELLARDLVSPIEVDRIQAETDLLNRTHWHPEHVLAMAAGKCPAADAHEDRIRDLERRRNLLRKEYNDMTSSRSIAVEDAEIIEDRG